MAFYEKFPYTNFQELNLDYILQYLKAQEKRIEDFIAVSAIKYADPIQWNITSQYETNTIVIDPETGTAYISTQPVPAGVALSNTDYWTVVFDLEQIITGIGADIEAERDARIDADDNERRERIAADEDLQEQIDNIVTETEYNRGYYGMCRLLTSNQTGLVYTEDFTHIYTVKALPFISDAASIIHVGSWYYATFSNTYYKSKDLISWVQGANIAVSPFSYSVWAGVLSKLKDDTYIFLASYQYLSDDNTIVNAVGANAEYFKTMYCPVTFDDDNGEIIFGTLADFPVQVSNSEIDPWLIYHEPTQMYVFAVKDEINCTISWYRGTELNSLALWRTNNLVGIEAPSMVIDSNGDIITTADYYVTGSNAALGFDFLNIQQPLFSYVYRDDRQRSPIWDKSCVNANHRHMTWQKCDAETYDKLMKIGIHGSAGTQGLLPFPTATMNIITKSDGSTNYTFYPIPHVMQLYINNNIPALTLNIPIDTMTNGNDIVLRARYACAVTLGTGFVAASQQTYNLQAGEFLVLKPLHNIYCAFKP